MTRLTLTRFLGGFSLAGVLLFVSPGHARAQQQPVPGEATEESDDSLYGYIGTGLFAAVAIFAVCKSSRR